MAKKSSIEQIRERIEAAKVRIDDLSDERRTPGEVAAAIRQHLETPQVGQGLAGTGGVSAHAGGIARSLGGLVRPGGDPFDVAGHVLTLGDLAALLGADEVVKRLTALLAPACGKVPAAERRRAIEAARAELFALEVEEARLLMAAEDAGQTVEYRGEADPAAVLEAWR